MRTRAKRTKAILTELAASLAETRREVVLLNSLTPDDGTGDVQRSTVWLSAVQAVLREVRAIMVPLPMRPDPRPVDPPVGASAVKIPGHWGDAAGAERSTRRARAVEKLVFDIGGEG